MEDEQIGGSTGSEADRQAVFRVHQAYLKANAQCDPKLLQGVWGPDPSNMFFNLSGHTYFGLEHWAQLWDYYRPRIEVVMPYASFDQSIEIEGDVAWVAANRFGITRWVGEGDAPFPDGPTLSRSTEVLVREPEGWRIVHSHFSRVSEEPRPGDI